MPQPRRDVFSRLLDAALAWDARRAAAAKDAAPRIGAAVPLSEQTRWLVRQIAYSGDDPVLFNPDPHMADQQPANWNYSRGFGLYEEMLDNDPRLKGMVKQRQLAVLEHCPGRLRSREPGNAKADELHAFGEAVLGGIPAPRLESAHGELWFGEFYGFTAQAPDWQRRDLRYFPGGRERVLKDCFRSVDLLSRQRGLFLMTAGGEARVKRSAGDPEGEPLPPKSILWHTPNQRYEGPYGVPLARVLWRYSFMKKHAAQLRIIDLERFGSPYVILTYADATQSEIANYRRDILPMIQRGNGLLIPKNLAHEIVNVMRQQGTSPHETWAQFCNEEMAIAILGETLTASQGDKGTQALGTVHLSVRDSIVQSDADKIAGAIQRLLDWHVELNYGPEWVELSPVYEINTRHEDPDKFLARAERAQKMGYPVSLAEVSEKAELSIAEDEDDLLAPLPQLANPGLSLLPAAAARRPQTKAALKARREAQAQASDAGLEVKFSRHAPAAHAEASEPVSPDLEAHYQASLDGALKLAEQIPDAVEAWINEQFAARGIGPDEPLAQDDPRASQPLPWADFTLPEELRAALVDHLNDAHTIAQLLGRERVLKNGDAVPSAQAALNTRNRALAAAEVAPPDDPLEPHANPLVTALWGQTRIIPRQVLSVHNRRVRQSTTWDTFYQLDALGRAASFTAWDLCEADVRHLGGALQDAINWGQTYGQFARYVREHLRPRYVTQEEEGLHAWHLETIYIHNISEASELAAADGIWEDRDVFEYVMFANPAPIAACCVERAGKVWRTDSAFLADNKPPLHFRCRSFLVGLTREQAEADGLSVESMMPQVPPQVYAGPKDAEGNPIGNPQPFGAWAPLEERYAALEEQLT